MLLQKIHQWLLYSDFVSWYYINSVWHNAFLDAVVPFLRNQWTWAPLYLFLAIFMPMNFGRKGWMWCVFFILTFSLSDYVSASVIKPMFHRLRPCNNPYLSQVIHLLVPCGSGYSFPSSHAANHFGLATFAATSLQGKVKHIWWIAIIWAILVCYAQVYVGVHFPLDVTCGAMLGIAVGILTGRIYKRVYNLDQIILPAEEQST